MAFSVSILIVNTCSVEDLPFRYAAWLRGIWFFIRSQHRSISVMLMNLCSTERSMMGLTFTRSSFFGGFARGARMPLLIYFILTFVFLSLHFKPGMEVLVILLTHFRISKSVHIQSFWFLKLSHESPPFKVNKDTNFVIFSVGFLSVKFEHI